MSRNVARKLVPHSILKRVAQTSRENAWTRETVFVNHWSVACRIKWSQGVTRGRGSGVPTSARGGEARDCHALFSALGRKHPCAVRRARAQIRELLRLYN